MAERAWAILSRRPIRGELLARRVASRKAGAVAVFLGTVRDDRGPWGRLKRLEYEAYAPQALPKLKAVAQQALRRCGAQAVIVQHRTGPVRVGEAAVGVAVAAAHRQEAFKACRMAIDELKRAAAVWKREVGTRGARWQQGIPLNAPSGGPVRRGASGVGASKRPPDGSRRTRRSKR